MEKVQIWSSGGGVQSAAIAALIVQGRIAPPDMAVIVDTEREKSSTWKYMDDVITPALTTVGVTLHRILKSEYEKTDLYGGADKETLLIPAFTTAGGDVGKLPTYCSAYWKREVVKRWARAQGVKSAVQWLGISVDEKHRAKRSKNARWKNRYPLIELRLNRGECIALVKRMGWPTPPKSSCWMCPNQTAEEWRDTRSGPDWQKVIFFDREMRKRDSEAFLHHDAVPIEQADMDDKNGILFRHCDSGMCFV